MKIKLTCLLLILAVFTLHAQDIKYFLGKNGKYGYKDKDGKVIIEPKYALVNNFYHGIAKVNFGGKHLGGSFGGGSWGYIDVTGKEVIPVKYDMVGALPYGDDFSQGRIAVMMNNKWGFVDSATGKEIDSLKYDKVFNFFNGVAMVKLNGKEGRIDLSGKEVIPPIYDMIGKFDDFKGLAPVELNGKWGYVNKQGKIVIPIKYDYVDSYFIRDKAKVKLGTEEFYINILGKRIQ